jgi:hypothetical protein
VFHAYRVGALEPAQAARLRAALESYLGRFYDFHYAPDDAEIYCSELTYKCYDQALGLKLGVWQKLGDLDWRPFEAFIRSMENGTLPLERPMITPVGLTRSPLLTRVYPKDS